jgi:hypothetical protein
MHNWRDRLEGFPMPPIVHWLFYDCLLSVVPVGLVWISFNHILGWPKKWADILRDGQLFFYCSTLAAAAIGDVTAAAAFAFREIWISGLICSLLASSIFYGVALASQDWSDKDKVARASWVFALSATAIIGFLRYNRSMF